MPKETPTERKRRKDARSRGLHVLGEDEQPVVIAQVDADEVRKLLDRLHEVFSAYTKEREETDWRILMITAHNFHKQIVQAAGMGSPTVTAKAQWYASARDTFGIAMNEMIEAVLAAPPRDHVHTVLDEPS